MRALAKAPADRFAERGRVRPRPRRPRSTGAAGDVGGVRPGTDSAHRRARPPRVPPALARSDRDPALALGVLFAWLRSHGRGTSGDAGAKRVAVLPFENLGDAEDEYFADGMTDAVRGKLAALPASRSSPAAARASTRRRTRVPQQIGRELGVEYLLTGTVRWEKDAGGPSRVQVSPELVQVRTASTKWQAAVRRRTHRRIPGAGRRRRPGGRGARRRARRGRARATRRAAHARTCAAYDAFLRGEEAAHRLASG